jgi:hypothetical protein
MTAGVYTSDKRHKGYNNCRQSHLDGFCRIRRCLGFSESELRHDQIIGIFICVRNSRSLRKPVSDGP